MANCPKCGYKLRLRDWRPNCPKCGVNLVYYNMEERLLIDADKAESEHAMFQKRIDRVKAAFTGSKLAILRIVLSVLPIAGLFLPLAKVSLLAPYIEKSTTVNAMAFYETVSKMDFGGLMELTSSKLFGSPVLFFLLAVVCFALTAVLILVNLIVLMLSCSPHGKGRNITINSLMLVLCAAAVVLFMQSSTGLHDLLGTAFSGSVQFGAYILIGFIFLLLAINVVLAKKGVPVKYKQTYVNGIPSEIYFEAVKNGEDIAPLREQYAEKEEEKTQEEPAEAKEETSVN